MSLFNICIEETVNLLKDNYWSIGLHDFEENNPFTALTSDINEKLISAVVDSSYPGSLSVTDLYPMLISGRVIHFKLDDILIDYETLISILTVLSIQGRMLKVIILNQIRYAQPKYSQEEQIANSVASAVESLLMLSPSLKTLKIGIPFDLKTIQRIPALKQLEINFIPKSPLSDILPRIDDDLVIPNDTITHLSVLKTPQYIVSPEEMAFIIQYCTKLKYLENDICGGLELLHSCDLFEGTLSKQYKLEKITLGDTYNIHKETAVATMCALHIVSLTCPNLKQLDVLVNDSNAIVAVREFKNLECLLVQWEKIAYPEDFRLGVKFVLEEIGTQLTNLTINYFSNVDFGTIGRLCPNLKALRVEYETELPSEEIPRYEHLEYLHLECNNGGDIRKHTLLQLLSFSTGMSYLYLEKAACLDDDILHELLQVNSMSKLSEVHLMNCSLSEVGLQSLVESCIALDLLEISSIHLSFETAAQIVHSINPMAIVIF